MDKNLTLVVPVYNEAENITALIEAAKAKINRDYRVYCVYDTDSDTTVPVLQELMPSHPEIELVRNAYGRGVLNAIRTGMEKAPAGAVVVTMADLSDDLAVVDKMYDMHLEGYDVVCGSRYMRGGRQIGGPLIKRTMSRLAGVSLHYLTRIPTRDVTNSFKLYSKKLLDDIDIESSGGFEIGMELVIKAYLGGYRVGETPTSWTDRTAGQSNFNVRRLLPHYIHWYLFAIRHKTRDSHRF